MVGTCNEDKVATDDDVLFLLFSFVFDASFLPFVDVQQEEYENGLGDCGSRNCGCRCVLLLLLLVVAVLVVVARDEDDEENVDFVVVVDAAAVLLL
jgi:hypothetical protein